MVTRELTQCCNHESGTPHSFYSGQIQLCGLGHPHRRYGQWHCRCFISFLGEEVCRVSSLGATRRPGDARLTITAAPAVAVFVRSSHLGGVPNHLAGSGVAFSTRRTYGNVVRKFQRFCQSLSVPDLPASSHSVELFCCIATREGAVAFVCSRVSCRYQRQPCVDFPSGSDCLSAYQPYTAGI